MVNRVKGALETLAVTYEDPCPPGEICAPPLQYWLAVGTVTLTNPSRPTLLPSSYVFTEEQYFVGAFLPTIIAVLFALPWMILDDRVRNLEPFHQLSRKQGASGATLCMDYISPFAFAAPVKALMAGHWAPLLTSLLSISTIFIAPLASETVSIRLTGSCDAETTGCIPSLSIFPATARTIEALLAFMAIITILLLIYMRQYFTGVFAEPLSIAGIATLFHNEEVSTHLREAGPCYSKKQLNNILANRRYKLDFYIDQHRWRRYGLVPLDELSHGEQSLNTSFPTTHTGIERNLSSCYPHRISAASLICFLSSLLAIIIYYRMTDSTNRFENFMDSQGFGVRFLFTSIGVIIRYCWGTIFRGSVPVTPLLNILTAVDVVNLEACTHLAKRNSNALNSILVSKSSSPLAAILPSLRRGHFFVASVAFTAFLADVLTVSLSNIPFDNATTYTGYTAVTWLSCSIIAFMIITLIATFFYRQPDLPLQPNTIGAVLSYLCSSNIPKEFSDMALLDGKTRNQRIVDMHLKYGIGTGRDDRGLMRNVIDIDTFDSRARPTSPDRDSMALSMPAG
jgi:hypothetical protein